MELHLQQQFDLLLREAAGNFAERTVHRAGGPQAALAGLRADPDAAPLHRGEFVRAYFAEHLVDSPAGAAFVLEALATRPWPADPGGRGEDVLIRLAHAVFADVLVVLAVQLIEQAQIYQEAP